MTPAEIRAFRHSLGLSAGAFARAIGVSDGRLIRRWEAGDCAPHGSFLVIAQLAADVPGVVDALVERAGRLDKGT